MKQGASPVDKKDIEVMGNAGLSVKVISKRLGIAENIVKNWMPKVVKKAAK